MSPRSIVAVALLALLVAACGSEHSQRGQPSNRPERPQGPQTSAADADRAQIRDVIRRWNDAELAGDTTAMCALVDSAKRYLEQIGEPCEVLQGGTLTPEAERDLRSSRITSIEIHGDDAVAHAHEASGAHDLKLRRSQGHWLIVGIWNRLLVRPKRSMRLGELGRAGSRRVERRRMTSIPPSGHPARLDETARSRQGVALGLAACSMTCTPAVPFVAGRYLLSP